MTRRCAFILVALAFFLGSGTPSAHAWSVNTRVWLAPQITYHAEGAQAWQAANYAAFVWRRAGVSFVPVHDHPDVTVRIAGRCGGEATVGYRRPAYVRIGRCALAPRALLAAHEFGHVLGLAHEDRYCSRMNSHIAGDGTPARCARHSSGYWLRHPLTGDDFAGARFIERQARRFRREASRRSDSNR